MHAMNMFMLLVNLCFIAINNSETVGEFISKVKDLEKDMSLQYTKLSAGLEIIDDYYNESNQKQTLAFQTLAAASRRAVTKTQELISIIKESLSRMDASGIQKDYNGCLYANEQNQFEENNCLYEIPLDNSGSICLDMTLSTNSTFAYYLAVLSYLVRYKELELSRATQCKSSKWKACLRELKEISKSISNLMDDLWDLTFTMATLEATHNDRYLQKIAGNREQHRQSGNDTTHARNATIDFHLILSLVDRFAVFENSRLQKVHYFDPKTCDCERQFYLIGDQTLNFLNKFGKPFSSKLDQTFTLKI